MASLSEGVFRATWRCESTHGVFTTFSITRLCCHAVLPIAVVIGRGRSMSGLHPCSTGSPQVEGDYLHIDTRGSSLSSPMMQTSKERVCTHTYRHTDTLSRSSGKPWILNLVLVCMVFKE